MILRHVSSGVSVLGFEVGVVWFDGLSRTVLLFITFPFSLFQKPQVLENIGVSPSGSHGNSMRVLFPGRTQDICLVSVNS